MQEISYGYCHKSERFEALKLGHCSERVSVISGWWRGSTIAPMVFEGYCNTELVCEWIEQLLYYQSASPLAAGALEGSPPT